MPIRCGTLRTIVVHKEEVILAGYSICQKFAHVFAMIQINFSHTYHFFLSTNWDIIHVSNYNDHVWVKKFPEAIMIIIIIVIYLIKEISRKLEQNLSFILLKKKLIRKSNLHRYLQVFCVVKRHKCTLIWIMFVTWFDLPRSRCSINILAHL